MNRREALSTLALSGLAATAIGPAASGASRPSWRSRKTRLANRPIRVALIGARNMGGKTHMPSLISDPDCELAAICDVDTGVIAEALEKANTQYAEQGQTVAIKTFTDFRELLQDDAIDAVVVAVPDHWHVPITKAAVAAGKDVYVEKPLSLYVTEGRELVDFVKESDAIVQVGSQHRSMDRIFLAQSAVQSGLLGKINHTEVRIATRPGVDLSFEPQPVPPELDYDMWVGPVVWNEFHPERVHYNFRFVSDFSGGEIANWGAHFLDSAQQILGLDEHSPVRVEGTGKRQPAGGVHSSFFDINVDYRYADGTTMNFSSATEDRPMGIEIQGEKATLFVSREVFKIDRPELLRELPKDQAQSYRRSKGSHLRNWFECIRSRKKEDLHAPLEIAHRSAILCHLANIAIEVGRPLQWDPEREIFVNDAFANAQLNRPVRDQWRV